MIKVFILFGMCSLAIFPSYAAVMETHHVSFLGNHSFLVGFNQELTADSPPRPVMIVLVDHFFDAYGPLKAAKKGFYMEDYIDLFAGWNMVTIVPLKFQGKGTVMPAVDHLIKQLPWLDPQQVYVTAYGDSAATVLSAFQYDIDIRKIVLIMPILLDGKGWYSLKWSFKLYGKIPETLIMEVSKRFTWRKGQENILVRFLNGVGADFNLLRHDRPREWYWDPSNPFVLDMFYFLFKGLPPTIYNSGFDSLQSAE